MDSLPHQVAEKIPLHFGLLHRTGEGDLHGIAEAEGGAVGPGRVRLAQNDLHALNVGLHHRRHLEGAGVGEGGGIGAAARDLVAHRHGQIFQRGGDDLKQAVLLEHHVAGDHRLHFLAADVQTHMVVDLGDDLRKSVIAQLGIDGGPDRQDEVPQRFGRKVGPQIDGDCQSHRQLSPPPLPALLGQYGLDKHRRQIFRHGRAIAMGRLPELVQWHQTHGHVQRVKGLRRTIPLIGPPIPHPLSDPGLGIAEVGILLLLPRGRLIDVQDPVGVGDVVPQLPEIDGQQRAEQRQGPGSVGQGVKDLQRDPVSIVKKTDEPAIILSKAHRLAWIFHILLDKGARRAVGLKVIPEGAPLNADPESREPGQGLVDGPLQRLGVHQLCHHGGKTVDRRVVLLLNGGVHHGRIVQLVPNRLLPLLPRHPTAPPLRSRMVFYHSTDAKTRRSAGPDMTKTLLMPRCRNPLFKNPNSIQNIGTWQVQFIEYAVQKCQRFALFIDTQPFSRLSWQVLQL